MGSIVYRTNRLRLEWCGERRPPACARSFVRLLKYYGKPRIEFDTWIRNPAPSTQEALARVGVTEDPAVLLKQYSMILAEIHQEGLRPSVYPQARYFFLRLVSLVQRRPAIVSTHPSEHLKAEIAEYRLAPLLGEVVGSITDKTLEIKRMVAEAGASPERTLLIGDSIYDVRAGKAAGVRTVGVQGGYYSREALLVEKPDLVVGNLAELFMHLSGSYYKTRPLIAC